MLRALRVIGILVFALLVGFSAYRIQQLYASGRLFEQYNSERRANITLLAVSVIGLGVLGFFELTREKRLRTRKGFSPADISDEPVDDGLDTANIYSAPETLDKWQGRRIRTSTLRHHESREIGKFWIGLLRTITFSTPVVYILLLVACLTGRVPVAGNMPVLCGMGGFMLALSLVSAVGIMRKKAWGRTVGYAIAIIHLLFFPVGTAAGLILLMGLVGAASLFSLSPREQRQAALAKRQKNLNVA